MNKAKSRYKLIFISIFMCILGSLFYHYEYYLRVVPGVIRPELKLAYNISEAGFGFLVGLYYWAYVPLQLIVGLTMDVLGPRKALTIACFISALGTYFFAGTDNFLGQLLLMLGC